MIQGALGLRGMGVLEVETNTLMSLSTCILNLEC